MIITQLSRARDNLHIHVIILAKQVRPVLQLQQINHAHALHAHCARVGVVTHHRADVVAADGRRHLRPEFLVDVVNADLAQLVAALRAGEDLARAQFPVKSDVHVARVGDDKRRLPQGLK